MSVPKHTAERLKQADWLERGGRADETPSYRQNTYVPTHGTGYRSFHLECHLSLFH